MTSSTPVYLSSIWDKEPIYHRRSRSGYSWLRNHTECGRLDTRQATVIPLRTAQKIGRACKLCWPHQSSRPRPVVPTSHGVWRALQA